MNNDDEKHMNLQEMKQMAEEFKWFLKDAIVDTGM
jgi:hypothetical protein